VTGGHEQMAVLQDRFLLKGWDTDVRSTGISPSAMGSSTGESMYLGVIGLVMYSVCSQAAAPWWAAHALGSSSIGEALSAAQAGVDSSVVIVRQKRRVGALKVRISET
jgi:hypothetical protein